MDLTYGRIDACLLINSKLSKTNDSSNKRKTFRQRYRSICRYTKTNKIDWNYLKVKADFAKGLVSNYLYKICWNNVLRRFQIVCVVVEIAVFSSYVVVVFSSSHNHFIHIVKLMFLPPAHSITVKWKWFLPQGELWGAMVPIVCIKLQWLEFNKCHVD